MTSTAPGSFLKLIEKIPLDKIKYIQLIPLRQNKKVPETRGSWLDTYLNTNTVLKRLKWGKNYGIVAHKNGLMFLDIDVDEPGVLKASTEFISKIPETFTVQTRNGGLQYYFWNNGLYSNQNIKEDKQVIGELRAINQYVVGVGSYVVPDCNFDDVDGTYRILLDTPISNLDNQLKDYLIEGTTTEKEREKEGDNLPKPKNITEGYKPKGKKLSANQIINLKSRYDL